MKKAIAILLVLCSLCLVACGSGGTDNGDNGGNKGNVKYTAFSEAVNLANMANVNLFETVPAPAVDDIRIQYSGDFGDGYQVLALRGIKDAEYKAYVELLENAGFAKVVDNGTTGIDGTVFSSTHKGEDLVLNVSYARSNFMLYLSAVRKAEISPYQTYDASYVANNIEGAKTTLTMHQVPEYGNCFVIQLKNGHYIVNDGGWEGNHTYLLDYLEANAPEGQKAVVEAWFISHEHEDHMYFIKDASQMWDLTDRVAVEGFYVSQVSDAVVKATGANTVGWTNIYRCEFRNSAGEMTPIYRVHMGDRYYFNDITVEVPYTQEQYPTSDYASHSNLNASCTWLMYHIEGQKFLLSGDTQLENMQYVMETYSEEYLDVDIMNHHHHSLNIYTDDLNYYKKVETLLFSTWGTYSIYWPKEVLAANLEIEAMGIEYLSYMDGGKRFTFPYTVGEYENLEPWYPDQSAYCVERQANWLKEAGLS